MKTFWSDTKANGQPLTDGRVCYVVDPEDGTNPQYIYGKDQDEIFEKLALNNVHAQRAIQQARSAPAATTPPAPGPVAVPKPRLTADQLAQATADLSNPGKSGKALATLVEDATGVDLNKIALQNFANVASAWQKDHPEFYPSLGNKRLLVDQAKAHTHGEISRITFEILTRAFTELSQQGYLAEAPAGFEHQPPTPYVQPNENSANGTDRPRGAQFATGARSTRFSAPQTVPTKTIKYTADEIRRMPESKSIALIESNDKDYAEACEFHFGDTRNTA